MSNPLSFGMGEKPESTVSWGFRLTPAQRWAIRAIEVLPPEAKKKLMEKKRKWGWGVKPKHPDVKMPSFGIE